MSWLARVGLVQSLPEYEPVEVPDLVGLNRATTRQVLQRAGLRLGRVELMVSSDVQPDAVISQSPPAGRRVKAGREITVVLSQGPLRIIVPELRGISLRNARLLVNESDLAMGLQSQVHHPDYEFGTVIAQYPLPGSRVAPQTEVFFLTSLGPKERGYVLPDLVGKRLSQIAPLMRDSNPFHFEILRIVDPNQPADTIFDQHPPMGDYVGLDSTVVLTVTTVR